MVKTLAAEVEKGERVFAVVGASHVVKQERALKKLFVK
jgi:pheromone shutdown protein TraB